MQVEEGKNVEEEKMPEPGRMKIFFGYAAGVGKTYAMLEAAHQAKAAGIDASDCRSWIWTGRWKGIRN